MSPCRLLQQCTQSSVSGHKPPCRRDLSIDRPGQIMSADGVKLYKLTEFRVGFSVGGIPGSQNNMKASLLYLVHLLVLLFTVQSGLGCHTGFANSSGVRTYHCNKVRRVCPIQYEYTFVCLTDDIRYVPHISSNQNGC